MTEQPESGRLLDMLHRLFSSISLMDREKRKKACRSQTGAAAGRLAEFTGSIPWPGRVASTGKDKSGPVR